MLIHLRRELSDGCQRERRESEGMGSTDSEGIVEFGVHGERIKRKKGSQSQRGSNSRCRTAVRCMADL